MTAPNGPILFNSSTGSDTAASGLGPSTAVTGSGAATTSASAVVTGISTTGVTAGDLLWVSTSTGRQYSIIASVDSGSQVTCDDTFGVTATGQTWAIGGKRSTWDNANSRKVFSDARGQWMIQTETDQTISSAITLPEFSATDGFVEIRGANASRSTITQTANTYCFLSAATFATISDLKMQNSNESKSSAHGIANSGGDADGVTCINCVFGDSTNSINNGYRRLGNRPGSLRFIECLFQTTGDAINLGAPTDTRVLVLDKCRLDSCDLVASANSFSYSITQSIFNDSKVTFTGNIVTIVIRGNIFYNSSGDMIDMSSGVSLAEILGAQISNNIFVGSGGYAINAPALSTYAFAEADYNAFYNNTSGDRNNLDAGDNDITLTADPFVDAAAGDFNINDTAGGGALLRAATVTMP